MEAKKCAERLYSWMRNSANIQELVKFSDNLVELLKECIPSASKLSSNNRTKMWEKLFKLQTSNKFKIQLLINSNAGICVLFYQRVTDLVVEKLIFNLFEVIDSEEKEEHKCTETSLTYEERNAIKYAVGHVIRNLRKKIEKICTPSKG